MTEELKKKVEELEAKVKYFEDKDKAEMDAAEKAARDEKYRMAMLGHDNCRWDFSDAMHLLPSDPNLNDVRLQQVGKNNWLNFDRWGINPDFIKRFPNKCVGSGFEWYDHNGKPYFWVTDGRVTDASNWEGTVALELKPGQKAEQGTLYPVHKGTLAGADPVWWNNYQTRVSFKHRGGAIRVTVKPYPEQGWSWDAVEEPAWYRPHSELSGVLSCGRCKNGKVIAVYGGDTHLTQAYAEDLDAFLSRDYTLMNPVPIFEGSRRISGALFNDDSGNLYLCITRTRSEASNNKQQVAIYKSASGNGQDENSIPDWVIYSTVRETQYGEGNVMSFAVRGKPGVPLILPGGRWVLPYVRFADYYGDGAYIYATGAIATSDDGGISWVHRFESGTFIKDIGHMAKNFAVYSGNIWWLTTSTTATGWGRVFRSPDNGDTWYLAYNLQDRFGALPGIIGGTFYTYGGYLWLFGAKHYPENYIILRSTNPMSLDSWEVIWEQSRLTSNTHPIAAYFAEEQERVWIIGHHVLGRKKIEPDPLVLVDNSEEGLIDKYGNEIGVIKQGEYLDYEYIANWAYMNPPAPDNPDVPYLVTGYHTFYFQPIPGQGRLKICFENIDDQGRACYIDAVQIEPDFTGKWPSLYSAGPRSIAPIDVIGMPGIGTPEWDEGAGSADQAPTIHASTHKTGAVDELKPGDIGAETPAGALAKADAAEGNANEYTDEEIAALDDVYLNKANAAEYIPADDYHPATKKYVDDGMAFTKLGDTPLTYTDNAGKAVIVNSTEDGLVFGSAPGGSGAYAETIGDGIETDYTITHNLGATDLAVTLWDLTGSAPVEATADATIAVVDENTITVAFGSAPDEGVYRVVVLSSGGSPIVPGVASLKADGEPQLTGGIALVAGDNVTLTQNTEAKAITIAATGGGGGGGDLIGEIILAADSDPIEFTNIPQTYASLYLEVTGRSMAAGTGVAYVEVQVGNAAFDTGSNYSYRAYDSYSTTSSYSDTKMLIGRACLPQAGSTAGASGSCKATFFNYADTSFWKNIRAESSTFHTGGSEMRWGISACGWKSTSAIERIRINTAMCKDSIIRLWGIPK